MCCKDDGDANIEIEPSPSREIDRDYRIKHNGNTAEDRRPDAPPSADSLPSSPLLAGRNDWNEPQPPRD